MRDRKIQAKSASNARGTGVSSYGIDSIPRSIVC